MAEPASAWKDSLPGSKMAFAVPVVRRADGSAVQLPVLSVAALPREDRMAWTESEKE